MRNYLCKGIALLMLLPSALLVAQITGGSIVGSVTDPSGAMVSNAMVTALNLETSVTSKTTTNETGRYEFPLLPTGIYTIKVEASGFSTAVSDRLELHAGTQPRIDFAMVLGQVATAGKWTRLRPRSTPPIPS